MDKRHILIEKAYKYLEPQFKTLEDTCEYIIDKGYWVMRTSQKAMMLSDSAMRPMTKKEDRETGEDQKGE